MSTLRCIWSHGRESEPWGHKSKVLAAAAAELDVTFEAFDFLGNRDPEARVEQLVTYLRTLSDPVALVGSSMGGYVTLAASMRVPAAGLFCIAPAVYMNGFYWQDFPWLRAPLTIVHGWRDEIVPVANVLRFASLHRPQLHIVDGDHRLNDHLPWITNEFRGFLRGLLAAPPSA